jgi:uncharacterized ion transporter superfamily protein YfcC
MSTRWHLPHPLALLLGCVAAAAMLTWLLPAGQFDRREDPSTGRTIVVAGTYRAVAPSPVGPLRMLVAIPRGLVEAAEVVAVVLLVGGAWVVVDRLGSLGRLIATFVSHFHRRGLLAVPVVSLVFAAMGALENMQEEIIPLVPALLLLGRRLRVDAITVVAMSAGAAMVGSAFGPTNPFQAGIARRLADLDPMAHGGVRSVVLVAAVALWIGWTMHHAARTRTAGASEPAGATEAATFRDIAALALMMAPMAAYVWGAMFLGWGFNELSAGFFAGGLAAGLVGGLGLARTLEMYLDGMKELLPAAVMVGLARSITLVLEDGRVIDTILQALSEPLSGTPGLAAAWLMLPFHVVVHVVVPSVSGHAVLTLPLLVPLSDLVGVSRDATVLAYQTGAGLTELLTPTNGALMAILLSAGVSFRGWFTFALVGAALAAVAGIVGMVVMQ